MSKQGGVFSLSFFRSLNKSIEIQNLLCSFVKSLLPDIAFVYAGDFQAQIDHQQRTSTGDPSLAAQSS